jgi:HPt (histidine-containing phosphotransfer) domain-containing protein
MIDPAASPHQGSDDGAEVTLDVDHLSRMTHGDRALEREVLQLFDRQAAMLEDRLRNATPQAAALCAHTLKGSARGIGAWRLARAAERVESVAEAGGLKLNAVIAQVVEAVDEARSAIAQRLLE